MGGGAWRLVGRVISPFVYGEDVGVCGLTRRNGALFAEL